MCEARPVTGGFLIREADNTAIETKKEETTNNKRFGTNYYYDD